MRVEDAGKRHPHRRHALDDFGVGGRRQAEAAVFLGNDGAEQPQRLHALDDVMRVFVRMIQAHHMLAHVALQKLVDGIQDLGLVLGGDRAGGRVHRLRTFRARH